MQSREHKLVITEKVLSRTTSRDPGRLCMVMLTEAGFSNASVTAHCWLNELLEAGTEYLMSLAWCEQLLWQEKGLLSSVEALNNSSPVQKDPPHCHPSTAPQHLGKVCGGLVNHAFAKLQVPLLKHICTCGFQAAALQFLQLAALQFAAPQLRLCALHAGQSHLCSLCFQHPYMPGRKKATENQTTLLGETRIENYPRCLLSMHLYFLVHRHSAL